MIKFGVAGNSKSFYDEGHVSTTEAAAWCAKRKIDIFEYSFGKGVNMTDATAEKIGKEFALHGVEMSVHCPYYINFANTERENIEKNFGYVLRSLAKLACFNCGDRAVFHPATQGKSSREEAFARAEKNIAELAYVIRENGFDKYKICIETMGKLGQIGTVEEVVKLCSSADFFYPCIDFGHVNARTGGSLKTPADFEEIIKIMSDGLPFEKVDKMHVHFSKIMYGPSGEIKHLTFSDDVYGPNFEDLAEVLVKYSLNPVIVCESDGTQAEDAVAMRRIYEDTLLRIS